MSDHNDGGAAFPVPGLGMAHRGMSLRDWFAGQALMSLRETINNSFESADTISAAAYCIADAMLAEREKKGAE